MWPRTCGERRGIAEADPDAAADGQESEPVVAGRKGEAAPIIARDPDDAPGSATTLKNGAPAARDDRTDIGSALALPAGLRAYSDGRCSPCSIRGVESGRPRRGDDEPEEGLDEAASMEESRGTLDGEAR